MVLVVLFDVNSVVFVDVLFVDSVVLVDVLTVVLVDVLTVDTDVLVVGVTTSLVSSDSRKSMKNCPFSYKNQSLLIC